MNIGFINLILIIADNAPGSREPGNPYFSTPSKPASLCSSSPIMSGTSCSFALVKSSQFSNCMTDFFANIPANLFNDFYI